MKKDSKVDPEHAKAEYAYLRILNLRNHKSAYFDGETSLYMKDEDIKKLLTEDINKKILEVKGALREGKFDKFETYPSPAQEAILSMAFNLGATKLLVTEGKWKKLRHALMLKDWNEVAKESNIKDISSERNAYHRNLFHRAAMTKPKANAVRYNGGRILGKGRILRIS